MSDFNLGKWLNKSKNVLTEGVADTYRAKCTVDVSFDSGAIYQKRKLASKFYHEVETITVNYVIEIEAREWGLKDVSVYGARGPAEIDFEIEVEGEGGESDFIDFKGKINWDEVEMEREYGEEGWTINPSSIELHYDKNCNFVNGTVNY